MKDLSAKSQHGVQYPKLPSAIRPVLHDVYHIPKLPREGTNDDEGEGSFSDYRHGVTTGIACQDQDFFVLTSSHLVPSHNKTLMILLRT
jgi:hypothetical protein